MNTYSRHMLETARGARDYLAAANEMIADFILSCQNSDGGFRGRARESDSYYTAFAADCLAITGHPLPEERLIPYITSQSTNPCDLIHAACLARCLAHISDRTLHESLRPHVAGWIEEYRVTGEGYCTSLDQHSGTPYGCFLALTAYQDVGLPFPAADEIAGCLERALTPGQGYGNEPGMPHGTVSATAAALMLQHSCGLPINQVACIWLLAQQDSLGGFRSSPLAPSADLLSTAVTLYILHVAGVSIDRHAPECQAFVEGMWDDRGGFRGHALDSIPDCEYTFYGLLALGCLVV